MDHDFRIWMMNVIIDKTKCNNHHFIFFLKDASRFYLFSSVLLFSLIFEIIVSNHKVNQSKNILININFKFFYIIIFFIFIIIHILNLVIIINRFIWYFRLSFPIAICLYMWQKHYNLIFKKHYNRHKSVIFIILFIK